jgi:hypothetical protein
LDAVWTSHAIHIKSGYATGNKFVGPRRAFYDYCAAFEAYFEDGKWMLPSSIFAKGAENKTSQTLNLMKLSSFLQSRLKLSEHPEIEKQASNCLSRLNSLWSELSFIAVSFYSTDESDKQSDLKSQAIARVNSLFGEEEGGTKFKLFWPPAYFTEDEMLLDCSHGDMGCRYMRLSDEGFERYKKMFLQQEP